MSGLTKLRSLKVQAQKLLFYSEVSVHDLWRYTEVLPLLKDGNPAVLHLLRGKRALMHTSIYQ